jgi:hypothetical protein
MHDEAVVMALVLGLISGILTGSLAETDKLWYFSVSALIIGGLSYAFLNEIRKK